MLVFTALSWGDAAVADLGEAAYLSVAKTVNGVEELDRAPGDDFTYSIEVGCDDNECIDATLHDALPEEFADLSLTAVRVSPSSAGSYTVSGCTIGSGTIGTSCTVDVVFSQALGSLDGVAQVGISAGTTVTVEIDLSVPTTLTPSWSANGVAVTNTATATSSTSNSASDSAVVTVTVPVVVAATAGKTWSDSPQAYEPGATSTIEVSTANASNLDASALVAQDPSVADDGASALDSDNPFRRVDFVSLGATTFPEGADLVQVDAYYFDGTEWSWIEGSPAATAALPSGASDTSLIGGIRVTFSSSTGATLVAGGSAGTQAFTVAQRESERETGEALLSGGTISNTVLASVEVPDQEQATDTASADLVVAPLDADVTAAKTITPSSVAAGASAEVTITATNTSSPGVLTSLEIAEPGSGADFFVDGVDFDAFTSWSWPSGATSADLTWLLEDGSTLAVTGLVEADGAPATPTSTERGGERIVGFTIDYSGSIAEDAAAAVTFQVDTDPTLVTSSDPVTVSNEVEVTGANESGTAEDQADATLTVYEPTIDISLDKTIAPSTATPGGTVLVQLSATTASGSVTVDPTTIVVRDVWDDDDFWNAFDATAIAYTDVPSGATLTVRYATGTPDALVWYTLETDHSGAYQADLSSLSSEIVGLEFTFTDSSGFGQGTTVQPNVTFTARDTLRTTGDATSVADADATEYDNLASAVASGVSGTLELSSSTVTDEATAGIVSYSSETGTLIADKSWVSPSSTSDLSTIPSLSGDQASTLLSWGVTTPGYDSVVISDPASGESSPGDTVFQAFDLDAVQAVSYETDPLLSWDTVSEVALYYDGAWNVVSAPSDGWMSTTGFVGYELTDTESASTTGVRITVVPDDTARAASVDPSAPAAGTGVASSTVSRTIPLLWTLRNTPRDVDAAGSDWVTATTEYNVAESAGVVENTVGVTATPSGGTAITRTAEDTIVLIDSDPSVKVSKTSSETSLVVPFSGDVDPADYPTASWTIDAWNTSSARASYITVSDPVTCSDTTECLTTVDGTPFSGQSYDPTSNPFESFVLTSIAFSIPSASNVDTAESRVALWELSASGTLTVSYTTVDAASTLTEDDLADVVGVQVQYQSSDPESTGGLIPQDETLQMTLGVRLLATTRSDADELVEGPAVVDNIALAQSFDPILAPSVTPYATDDAEVSLEPAALDVTASKSISPDTLDEPERSTPVTVTLGATDGDSTIAPESVTLVDDDADFWSAFEFTGLGSVELPDGAALVRVDLHLDGAWVLGSPAADAALPASVASSDLEGVDGVRVVYLNDPSAPFSATAPSADWSATAAFTAVVRDDVDFPTTVDDTMTATASHEDVTDVAASSASVVALELGTAELSVLKTASSHTVEPGVSIPWTLELENTGSGYLDLEQIVDTLPDALEWDGVDPTVTSTAADAPASGVSVEQSTSGELVFTWADGARLSPGDTITIELGLILLPGLTPDETAVNEFYVQTTQTLDACTTTSSSGTLTGLTDQQCGTSDYVSPKSGALLYTQKWVKGDVDGTLADGAVNVSSSSSAACVPTSEGFYRTVCAAETVVGGTDVWRLEATNSGTVAYSSLTFVDPLPVPDDRLLATGASRGSTYRPVFDPTGFADSLLAAVPSGATVGWEVTTAASPCVGDGDTTWNTDPTCSSQPVAAEWSDGDAYTGDWAAVTAFRVTIDFTGTASGSLEPGGTVTIEYSTINTPGASADAVETSPSADDQFAWNQAGITASLVGGGTLSRAPSRTGVTVQTGSLQLAKTVSGDAAGSAPDHVLFDLDCSVAGTPIDLGADAQVSVAPGSPVTIAGLPLGTVCTVAEHGDVGEFGESARVPSAAVTVQITSSELTDAQTVSIENVYDPASQASATDPAAGGDAVSTSPSTTDPATESSAAASASSSGLAFTGARLVPLAALVAALALAGVLLLVIGRRSRRTRA
ncbi:MAG: hypothetical protein QM635_09845 [Microbacteriaceae bacterium]